MSSSNTEQMLHIICTTHTHLHVKSFSDSQRFMASNMRMPIATTACYCPLRGTSCLHVSQIASGTGRRGEGPSPVDP